jgi:predicted transcriptional regulator
MNVSDLKNKLNLTVLTETDLDRPVTGCYIGDLLSWVMGKAQSGDCWITIMNNINIVAVASLTDCACILLCEGVSAEKDIIAKANNQDIIILQSDKTAYELAQLIAGELE